MAAVHTRSSYSPERRGWETEKSHGARQAEAGGAEGHEGVARLGE